MTQLYPYQAWQYMGVYACRLRIPRPPQAFSLLALAVLCYPGPRVEAGTCFSLLTALTCSVTMLLAVYPQKPAPESGTFTHAFSPCAHSFAPNRIIRATAVRLLVE